MRNLRLLALWRTGMSAPYLTAAVLSLAASAVRAEERLPEAEPVRQFILASKQAGLSRTLMADPGGKTYAVKLGAADDQGVTVIRDGGKILLAWKQLKGREVFALGRGLLEESGDVDGHLAVARLALALGSGLEMDAALERLQLDHPQEYGRIERVRAGIADQMAAQEPPRPAAPVAGAKPAGQPASPDVATGV